MTWAEFWNLVWRGLVEMLSAPKATGPDAKSFSVSVPLGSGYDRKAELARRLALLYRACNSVIENPAYAPRGTETFCNLAVREVAEALGCYEFSAGQNANAMVRVMQHGGGWKTDTGERAHAHAGRGGLAIAGKCYPDHGHVAIVCPNEMQMSDSWRKAVPTLANVGKRNGYLKTSEAFPVAQGEPEYFIWMGDPW